MASTELQKLMSQLKTGLSAKANPVRTAKKSAQKLGKMVQGPDGTLYDDEKGFYDEHDTYHPINRDDNETYLDDGRPDSSEEDEPPVAPDAYLTPGRTVHDDRRPTSAPPGGGENVPRRRAVKPRSDQPNSPWEVVHIDPNHRPPTVPSGGRGNGAAGGRGGGPRHPNNGPRGIQHGHRPPAASGGGPGRPGGTEQHTSQPPRAWPQNPQHAGQRPRSTRRDKNKIFNPEREYIVDNTSELYDFRGKIPQYTHIHDETGHIKARYRSSEGGLDLGKLENSVLLVMLRRIIAMYLHNKKEFTNFSYENSRYIKMLEDNAAHAEQEFKELEQSHGYVRPHRHHLPALVSAT